MNNALEHRNIVCSHAAISQLNSELTSLLPPRAPDHYDPEKLAILAVHMESPSDTVSNDPDPEENLYVPAGYTYLGQFIDHDLTLDTTSQLVLIEARQKQALPTNMRTPSFDLDNVYGSGPDDSPYMYVDSDAPDQRRYSGASLIEGDHDLPRVNTALNHRAIIGDKRNDENSIVCQIQMAFLHFHNEVVARLAEASPTLRGRMLFDTARAQVRWAYQRVLTEDFLHRIVSADVLTKFMKEHAADRNSAYKLFTKDKRCNLPREFTGAAYRYGHSGVRNGYVMNAKTAAPIFNSTTTNGDSLVGFEPLSPAHLIDNWARFFPLDRPRPGEKGGPNFDGVNVAAATETSAGNAGTDTTDLSVVRLQYAYKLDPSLVNPLSALPKSVSTDAIPASAEKVQSAPPFRSLAMLNLLRGNAYGLPSGEMVAEKLGVTPLKTSELVVRKLVSKGENGAPDQFKFLTLPELGAVPSDPYSTLGDAFTNDTPLWFYILAEAQKPLLALSEGGASFTDDDLLGTTKALPGVGALTQLGPVGGQIVTEVFYGLLDEDPDSIVNRTSPPPALEASIFPIGEPATFARMLEFAGIFSR